MDAQVPEPDVCLHHGAEARRESSSRNHIPRSTPLCGCLLRLRHSTTDRPLWHRLLMATQRCARRRSQLGAAGAVNLKQYRTAHLSQDRAARHRGPIASFRDRTGRSPNPFSGWSVLRSGCRTTQFLSPEELRRPLLCEAIAPPTGSPWAHSRFTSMHYAAGEWRFRFYSRSATTRSRSGSSCE